MPPAPWAAAEQQEQKAKLANSYTELLDEFSAKDLRTVGNYTVGRLIGKGSFGKVYLASHKLTNGSKVVLKSAKKDDSNLAREIHHHRQFVHPHIARLYEVIVTESLVWLVLEYCAGDELYNHITNHGRMEEATVQRVFTQLIGAVSYVHHKGCVHRDLKLENILLDKHDNVKLVDFGFTREYQGTTSYLQTWCGTICYSAPEMIKGEKYAGEKVDVWSLGIILYALLVGELPFDDDDESITKHQILKEDPKYPDYFPAGAKDLNAKLLSKRPLLRPQLADILRHPWLADHAPQQQEILKLQQPPPFGTQLEKDTLEKMRAAGVNIDTVIEHVLAQRCDGLAGWWALLLEKEERRERRRQKKRKEKEADAKSLRRLSAASGRLLAAPSLREINEEEHTTLLVGNPPKPRGRVASRSNASLMPPDLPRVAERRTPTPEAQDPMPSDHVPPQSINKDPARSTSSTRRRPAPPPKEYSKRPAAVSRNSSSMLRSVQNNSDLLIPPTLHQKRKRLYQQPLKDQLASIKTWFKESAKMAKSPTSSRKLLTPRPATQNITGSPDLRRTSTGQLLELRKANQTSRPEIASRKTYPIRPRLSTTSSQGSQSSGVHRVQKARPSTSPSPATPHASYNRRSFTGPARGRASTSSSVSSIRSIHIHHPGHSKASSTSSASPSLAASPNLSNSGKTARSPHTSVKILPATPTNVTGTFPSGVRVSRRPTPGSLGSLPTFSDAQRLGAQGPSPFSGFGPPSPGMHPVFAKPKRLVFKGPRSSPRGRSAEGSRAGSTNRGSMMITEEEDEEEAERAAAQQEQQEEQEQQQQNQQQQQAVAVAAASGILESEGQQQQQQQQDMLPGGGVSITDDQAFGPATGDTMDEIEEVDVFSPLDGNDGFMEERILDEHGSVVGARSVTADGRISISVHGAYDHDHNNHHNGNDGDEEEDDVFDDFATSRGDSLASAGGLSGGTNNARDSAAESDNNRLSRGFLTNSSLSSPVLS